jgi:hypothetical protein
MGTISWRENAQMHAQLSYNMFLVHNQPANMQEIENLIQNPKVAKIEKNLDKIFIPCLNMCRGVKTFRFLGDLAENKF